jgi:hypothetical protein
VGNGQARLRVFGGGRLEPITEGEIAELLELDNRIAQMRRRRDALGANLLRRVEAQGGDLQVGPHWLTLRRRSDGETRRVDLMVDGARRLRLVDEVR